MEVIKLKELDKQINSLMMNYEVAESEREELEIIVKIEDLIKEKKQSMVMNDEGESYLTIASNLLMSDVATFLENCKNDNDLPGKDLYEITVYSTSSGKYKIYINEFAKGALRFNGLGTSIQNFPQYTVFKVIGDKDKNIIKFRKSMTKSEFDKFIKLRELNHMYFYPYIKHIEKGLLYVEVLI